MSGVTVQAALERAFARDAALGYGGPGRGHQRPGGLADPAGRTLVAQSALAFANQRQGRTLSSRPRGRSIGASSP
jgi:hypothetical protein